MEWYGGRNAPQRCMRSSLLWCAQHAMLQFALTAAATHAPIGSPQRDPERPQHRLQQLLQHRLRCRHRHRQLLYCSLSEPGSLNS